MKLLAINILLALAWAALLGEMTTGTLLVGFLLAYGVLYLLFRKHDEQNYLKKLPRLISFLFYYGFEIIKSNLVIAYDILTPTPYMKPGVIAIPIKARNDLEITLLANLITMTPGTLSLDLSNDRKVLYVHAMYIDNPEKIRRQIQDELERRVLDIIR